ncbi:MAG: hypothetical protein ACFBSE_25580 [Prochloraceae cyanobacterium]
MSQINYETMSDEQLKAYFLANRNDNDAFHAYMDRLNQRPRQVLIAEDEIDHLPVTEQIQIIADRLSKSVKNK